MSTFRERTKTRLREVLAYLDQAGGTSSKHDVMEHLSSWTEHEAEELDLVSNGSTKWENAVLWETTNLVKALWMNKDGSGTWTITDLGREALAKYSNPVEFAAEADRLYNEWRDGRNGHKRQAWLISKPDLTAGWLKDGCVSIPTGDLTQLPEDVTSDQLLASVRSELDYLTDLERDTFVKEIDGFIFKVHVDDVVLATMDEQIFLGDVASEWSWTKAEGGAGVVQRNVEWRNIDTPISMPQIPGQLKAKITAGIEFVNLTKDIKIIDTLAEPSEQGDLSQEASPESVESELGHVGAKLAEELFIDPLWLNKLRDLLAERRQIILYGPPGTGKTYLATKLAEDLVGSGQVKLVQFHPSFTYEDFFEGFRPKAGSGNSIGFTLQPGPLRQLVTRAVDHPLQNFILIIDEINRANLAKVFGELYFLLEYRNRAVELLYSSGGEPFTLPDNLFLIGTMNTADRSIALVDSAMRRRFAFVALDPSTEPTKSLLPKWSEDNHLASIAAELLEELNRRIGDPDFQVGPSYFMRRKLPDAFSSKRLERIWEVDILPLLEEHFYGQWESRKKMFTLKSVLAGTKTGMQDQEAVEVTEVIDQNPLDEEE